MDIYKGKTLIIMNVASECSFVEQYDEFEKLYKKYKDKGLVILAFPCDQFGGQEPSTNNHIKMYCKLTYGVTFAMFAKTKVNGHVAHPLFKYLKSQAKGFLGTENIKWNFTKFLVDKNAEVFLRYGSMSKAKDIEKDLIEIL